MIIRIRIDNDNLSINEPNTIVSGSKNYYELQAAFSPEWDGLSKYVIFPTEECSVAMADDRAVLPESIIAESGVLTFGLIGIDGNGDLRISTNYVRLRILEGARELHALPPSPDADATWEGYIGSRIKEMLANTDVSEYLIKGYTETAKSYANSSFEEVGGADKFISNVRIIGTDQRFLITNIRNSYPTAGSDFTGFQLYTSNDEGQNIDSANAVKVKELKGSITVDLSNFDEGAKMQLDYDLTGLASGSRDAKTGPKYLVRKSCYQMTQDCITEIPVEYTSISMFQNFAVVGDSHASGSCYLPDNSSGSGYKAKTCYELSWGQNIARMNGISCVNLSAGGLTTRSWLTHDKGLSLMKSTEAQQLYFLTLGLNDSYVLGLDYLGSISDIKGNYKNNPDSFYGNYARIIEQIQEYAPDAKLIMSTMADDNIDRHKAFNAAIIEIADHYNIPCIELYNDAFFGSDFYKNHMVYGHPTAPVYAGMAKAIMRLYDKCVQDNIGYFMDYVG